jgi:multidrug efflux pump subunit AcrA (membrane-fusion protein)
LELSAQARANLGLVSKPAAVGAYWKTIQIPGVIVDRPGRTDRGVTAPAVGVIVEVHAHPGDTVGPGQRLFTLRLSSEYLQSSQSELFKAMRETELLQEQYARLKDVAASGAVPGARLIEVDQQLRRQTALIEAHRQDLLARGLTTDQVESAAQGRFVSAIDVVAPEPAADRDSAAEIEPIAAAGDGGHRPASYEVQELNVQLGEQVEAGQVLCHLADHNALFIEGHAFKQEASHIARAAQEGWFVRVEFAEDDSTFWPPFEQNLQIQHLSNAIDPATRTFDFFVSLANQSKSYERHGETFVVWRFRPGQRVRIQVPVEKLENVIVLPSDAIVREGPEAYVFRQNGDLFDRRPVHVLYEDRLNVVLVNDGSVSPGFYIAQSAAASLNRVLKAQAASGVPVGYHVHADGTVHGAH